MSSALDIFVLFVSFVVKQFCTSARGTSFSSCPFVALTQAVKMSRHQDRQEMPSGSSSFPYVTFSFAFLASLREAQAFSGSLSFGVGGLLISVRTGWMPVAKQDRRSKRIHRKEHEVIKPKNRSSASSSDFFVLFVSFVVKQFYASARV